MFGDLHEGQIDGAIEALLFVSDEPVNVITIAEMLEVEPQQAQDALARIAARREAEGSGILLREVAGGWRLYTAPAYHGLLEKYILSWDTRRLSQAALETLAIIAYGQPITRLGIASIRGVNSDSSVNSLIDKGLVRESGQADAPGYPMTYSTTRTFLEKFGLRSRDDLPPLEGFAPDEETARLLREGLSAHAHFGLREEDGFGFDDASIREGAPENAAPGSVAPTGEETAAAGESAPDGDNGLQTLFDAVGKEALDLSGLDASDALRHTMADLFAQTAGVVEKIDFDELEFEE